MMVEQKPEERPRQAGKTAERFAKMTGLKPDTCMDLLAAGWTLVREEGKPTRWEQGYRRRDIPLSQLLAAGQRAAAQRAAAELQAPLRVLRGHQREMRS